MNVSGLDVIARGADFEHAANRFELRPWQWQFLHALDGRTDLRDVASRCGVELSAATTFIEESEAIGLVRVVTMSYDEYCQWSGAPQPARYAPFVQLQTAYAERAFDPAPAHDDHFSTSDALGAYGTTVPEWMVEAPSHEEPAAEPYHEEPVAEWLNGEFVPESHHEEPVAEVHHEEPAAEVHHEEPVAEVHHEEPAAEVHHEEPVAEWHHEEPVAEAHHEEPVAEGHHEAPVAEVPREETYATPGVSSSNGHHQDLAWEPLPLVTTVDEHPAPVENPFEDLAGISISLGAAPMAEMEPESPRGSVSFSLSPEDAWPNESVIVHDEPPAARHDDAPATPAHEEMLVPQPVAVHEPVLAAAHEPTNGHLNNAPVAAPASGSSATADIVGNLIARALTFRIK